jgi:hypothetical protein
MDTTLRNQIVRFVNYTVGLVASVAFLIESLELVADAIRTGNFVDHKLAAVFVLAVVISVSIAMIPDHTAAEVLYSAFRVVFTIVLVVVGVMMRDWIWTVALVAGGLLITLSFFAQVKTDLVRVK